MFWSMTIFLPSLSQGRKTSPFGGLLSQLQGLYMWVCMTCVGVCVHVCKCKSVNLLFKSYIVTSNLDVYGTEFMHLKYEIMLVGPFT